jgi:hypothetical protein
MGAIVMKNVRDLFEPPATVTADQNFEREHALMLQAYNRFHEPILEAGFIATVAKVNQAVEWWNRVVVGGESA